MHRRPEGLPTPALEALYLLFATALSVVLAAASPAGALAGDEATPPDLRLEWLILGQAVTSGAEPIRGNEGQTVTVAYRLRNVGGTDAFAVVIEGWTALGRAAGPGRLQPGPAAGDHEDRSFRLALARGKKELCVEVRLQTVEPTHPGDPNPRDNRICRQIEIVRSRPAAPWQPELQWQATARERGLPHSRVSVRGSRRSLGS